MGSLKCLMEKLISASAEKISFYGRKFVINVIKKMRIGKFEIRYLFTGLESSSEDSLFAIGFAFRRYYLYASFRRRGKKPFYFNFVLGWHKEAKRFIYGINQ